MDEGLRFAIREGGRTLVQALAKSSLITLSAGRWRSFGVKRTKPSLGSVFLLLLTSLFTQLRHTIRHPLNSRGWLLNLNLEFGMQNQRIRIRLKAFDHRLIDSSTQDC